LPLETAYELAEYLDINPETVWRLVREKRLHCYDCGRGAKRFDRDRALEELLIDSNGNGNKAKVEKKKVEETKSESDYSKNL